METELVPVAGRESTTLFPEVHSVWVTVSSLGLTGVVETFGYASRSWCATRGFASAADPGPVAEPANVDRFQPPPSPEQASEGRRSGRAQQIGARSTGDQQADKFLTPLHRSTEP
jgi:hypothetical protein